VEQTQLGLCEIWEKGGACRNSMRNVGVWRRGGVGERVDGGGKADEGKGVVGSAPK